MAVDPKALKAAKETHRRVSTEAHDLYAREVPLAIIPDVVLATITAYLEALATPSTPVATNMPVGEEPRKQFPVLDSGGNKVDWQLVADHERQAQINHHQSVQGLASRGGLPWVELHAVLNDRRYEDMDDFEAMVGCRRIEAAYLSTPYASHSDASQMLREIVNQCNASGVTQVPAGTKRSDLEALRRLLDDAEAALSASPSPKGAIDGR